MYIPSSRATGSPSLRNLGILLRTLSRRLSWVLLLIGFLALLFLLFLLLLLLLLLPLLSQHRLLVPPSCGKSGLPRLPENQKDSGGLGSGFEQLFAICRRGRSRDGRFVARL